MSYFCNPVNKNDQIYWVRLSNEYQTKIEFNSYLNSLKINFDIWLNGDFNIPLNFLSLNVYSNIGNITDINMYECEIYNSNHHYKANINLNISDNKLLEKAFLKKLYFNSCIKVNNETINSYNLSQNFDNFIIDLNKINLESEIYFNNYYPIIKLDEFYINEKYKNTYKFMNSLPNDFYTWSKENMSNYPQYWFTNKANFSNLMYTPIYKIYQSNIGKGQISKLFDEINIQINYWINNTQKTLNINLNNNSSNNTFIYYDNFIYLDVITKFNFETSELYQSNTGVYGIYFPINTYGNINLELIKDNYKYIDNFNFNFNNDFYSVLNKNIEVKLVDSNQTNGYWYKLTC